MPTLSVGAAAKQPVDAVDESVLRRQLRLQTDYWSGSAGVGQLLPWGGGNYNVSFNSARTTTTNPLTTFTPSLTSSVQAVFSQPLLRDFKTDPARAQLDITQRNREIADLRLQEDIARTSADAETRVLVAGRRRARRSTCSSDRSISRWSSSAPTAHESMSASRRRSIW